MDQEAAEELGIPRPGPRRVAVAGRHRGIDLCLGHLVGGAGPRSEAATLTRAGYLSAAASARVAFPAAVTHCAYRGLESWRFIGIAWLVHTTGAWPTT